MNLDRDTHILRRMQILCRARTVWRLTVLFSMCRRGIYSPPHRPVCSKSKVNSELGLDYSSMSLNSKQQLPLDMFERGILGFHTITFSHKSELSNKQNGPKICGWMDQDNKKICQKLL